MKSFKRQRGAAILIALLTVTLVATFAASALWQQWRAHELEAAERSRLQAAWVLVGALDWSRLILRENARNTGVSRDIDHLAEPWAVPLQEAKLTSFLAADKNISSDQLAGLPEAFLSGQIVDAQSKLNVRNLVQGGKLVPEAVAAFNKLFEHLGLPISQVQSLASALLQASSSPPPAVDKSPPGVNTPQPEPSPEAPLMPQRLNELVWLGLPASTVEALEPYVTLLPTPTPLNLNTASAEVLSAGTPNLDLAGARRLVVQRSRKFFSTPSEALAFLQSSEVIFKPNLIVVQSSYFEARGRLRLNNTWVEERSLLRRQGLSMVVEWRVRGAGTTQEALPQ